MLCAQFSVLNEAYGARSRLTRSPVASSMASKPRVICERTSSLVRSA